MVILQRVNQLGNLSCYDIIASASSMFRLRYLTKWLCFYVKGLIFLVLAGLRMSIQERKNRLPCNRYIRRVFCLPDDQINLREVWNIFCGGESYHWIGCCKHFGSNDCGVIPA